MVSKLRPIFALFALFIRSLREDARGRLPPVLRATLVLVILLILWVNESNFTLRAAPGREFLAFVLFANLGLIAIATLGIFASAITEEKEDQTLTLLRMTKLSPLAILFGKGTARLVIALLLLAAQIPFTLLAVALGGVTRQQVLDGYAVLGATTFLLCNLALLCSVICRTTRRAGISTGAIVALLFFLLPVILFRLSPGAPLNPYADLLIAANPLHLLDMLLRSTSAQAAAAPVATLVSLNISAGLVCFLLSWLFFDWFCATTPEPVTPEVRRDPITPSIVIPSIWQIHPRPSIERPLVWKEFHFLLGGALGMVWRFALCGLILAGTFAYERWVKYGSDDFALYFFWHDFATLLKGSAAGMFAIEVLLIASRIFGDERRNRSLCNLVLLPKTSGWIIRQKLLGCLPFAIPSIGLFLLAMYLDSPEPEGPFAKARALPDSNTVFYVITQALLLTVLIAHLSLRIRRGALPASITIVAAINALTVFGMDVYRTIIAPHTVVSIMTLVWITVTAILALLTLDVIPKAGAAD